MRLILICVGRLKAGGERELTLRYAERAGAAGRALGLGPLELREFDESRARRAQDRMAEEAKAILAAVPAGADLIAFDENGKSPSSREFAAEIARRRDRGAPALAFAIGGADGLAPEARDAAALVLSFGRMTLPHQLVRALAAEQIYRAAAILGGHPYHRD